VGLIFRYNYKNKGYTMKFHATDTASTTFTGIFLTPLGTYTLNTNNFTATVETKEGLYNTVDTFITVTAQPTVTTQGSMQVTQSIPSSAKSGVVTMRLFTGSPQELIGSVQFYLLDSGGSAPEYTTTDTTTVPLA